MRLRTKLVLSYGLVVLIAVVASGTLAFPLLQDYQNKRYQAEVERAARENAERLDAFVSRTNVITGNNVLIKEAAPRPNPSGQPVWPSDPPSIDLVREILSRMAIDRDLRLVVIRPRDQLVVVDTIPDPAKSLIGQKLVPNRQSRNVPAFTAVVSQSSGAKGSLPSSSPTPNGSLNVGNTRFMYESLSLPADSNNYTLVARTVGLNGLNLFGLNDRGRPVEMLYGVIFSVLPEPDIVQDLLFNLGLAGSSAMVVSLIVGLILARSLSRPLVRLTTASEALAKGDYSYNVQPEGSYELVQLAKSFNHMSDEVEEYQRMQRELIGNVSHELKTPLTTIQGFSEAMLDGALKKPEDFASSAKIIQSETQRMIRLVNSLLDLSKLESGQIRLAREKLDLEEILKQSVLSFGPQAENARVELVTRLAALPPVLGDPDRLRQVFNNLIDNALKYTKPGGKVIVECRSGKENVVASVSDSGIGIPEKDLSHIFERFYQANKSRSREVAGIGLGLSITREILQAHHGRIEAASREGQGSVFTVTLPVCGSGSEAKGIPSGQVEPDKVYSNT